MRIPFDNLVLASVVGEIDSFVGGVVQEVRQPDNQTVTLQIYRRTTGEKGIEGTLLLSCHPQFARCHFITRRPRTMATPPVFCATLRARLHGAELTRAVQVARDRILRLTFQSEKGDHDLIAELMGKHSNLLLVDDRVRIVSACKWVPSTKSVREIQSGIEYRWPPVIREGLLEAEPILSPVDWIKFRDEHPEAVSKFFRDLTVSDPGPAKWMPSLVRDEGAYPLSLTAISPSAEVAASISIALEKYFSTREADFALESLRSSLLGQVDRIILARDVALQDIRQTLESGKGAGSWQMQAELILAYGPAARQGSSSLAAYDYEGNAITIELNPEMDFKENANRLFDRAKKAKSRVSTLAETADRLSREQGDISNLRVRIEKAASVSELQDIQEIARERRWLVTRTFSAEKGERPYEGHKIRELIGPGGIRVLYGDNAESNDYLTMKVAKPNDYWLHVRGSTSTHVVVQTSNHPEKIGKEHLMFAAKVAVQNSPSKHAGYVPVDYTLKKYVRKPRGSAKGTAVYTNEKTVHVES